MKTERNIFVAFCLNLLFAFVELAGGIFTGSVAIISDAIHDFGDCFSIGASFALEKVSKRKPDEKYTYGYYRYSVLGSVIQSMILLCGSALVIYHAFGKLLEPQPIHYDGMIALAVLGFCVNILAAVFTSGEGSLNQKAINLHLLEDVLGWVAVLVGAVVMKFTNWQFIDPILSIILALFIGVNAFRGIKTVLDIFLEKVPENLDLKEVVEHLREIEGVRDIHHFHVWSMDGYRTCATLHAVTEGDMAMIKRKIKEELAEHHISHCTVECEAVGEECADLCCDGEIPEHSHGHHHHHHHH